MGVPAAGARAALLVWGTRESARDLPACRAKSGGRAQPGSAAHRALFPSRRGRPRLTAVYSGATGSARLYEVTLAADLRSGEPDRLPQRG